MRDEALSSDGRFLYTLDADARKVFAFAVRDDGRLDPVGDFDGLPDDGRGARCRLTRHRRAHPPRLMHLHRDL